MKIVNTALPAGEIGEAGHCGAFLRGRRGAVSLAYKGVIECPAAARVAPYQIMKINDLSYSQGLVAEEGLEPPTQGL